MAKDKGGKGGTVINVSSCLGLQPMAGCPIYVGTKHFVIGFSRSIGDSFYYKKHGVKVMVLCPGVTATNIIENADEYALPGSGKYLAEHLGEQPLQS